MSALGRGVGFFQNPEFRPNPEGDGQALSIRAMHFLEYTFRIDALLQLNLRAGWNSFSPRRANQIATGNNVYFVNLARSRVSDELSQQRQTFGPEEPRGVEVPVRRSANLSPQDDGPSKWEDSPHVRVSMRRAPLDRAQRVSRLRLIA
jgi:hypothetical protein